MPSRSRARTNSAFKMRFEETYHKPGLRIKEHCLPTLPSASRFEVVEAYILKAGVGEKDGIELEYQDVRIYLKVKE